MDKEDNLQIQLPGGESAAAADRRDLEDAHEQEGVRPAQGPRRL